MQPEPQTINNVKGNAEELKCILGPPACCESKALCWRTFRSYQNCTYPVLKLGATAMENPES